MRHVLTCTVLGLFAMASSAAGQVEVRSGEHGSFTRLVFYLEAPVSEWEAVKTPGGLMVGPVDTSEVPEFELGSVFDFIPRVRIADLRITGRGLEIASDCACDITVFPYRDDVLVIDFADVAPGQSPDYSGLATGFSDVLPQHTAGRTRGAVAVPVLPPAKPAPVPSVIAFDIGKARERSVSSDAILRSLSDNIANGILSPAPRRTTATVLIGEGKGIQLSSALHPRPGLSDAPQTPETACPAPGTVDLSTTAVDTAQLLGDLQRAKAALAEVLDADPTEDAVALARAYLVLGFGAEARQVLEAYAASDDATKLLGAVAAIVDMPGTPVPDYPPAHVACSGMASVWATIAAPSAQLSRYSLDAKAILRTLSGLPPVLRRHLAPHVSKKFADLGLDEDASIAMAAADRAAETADAATATRHGPASAPRPQRTAPHTDAWSTPVAAAHFDANVWAALTESPLELPDRILIEAAIKDAPDGASRLEAIAHYAQRLAEVGKPVVALSYLDQVIGGRMLEPDALSSVLDAALDAVAENASDGQILAVSAALEEKSWFRAANLAGKASFLGRSAQLRGALGLAEAVTVSPLEAPRPSATDVRAEDVVSLPEPAPTRSALASLLDASEGAVADADAISAELEALLETW